MQSAKEALDSLGLKLATAHQRIAEMKFAAPPENTCPTCWGAKTVLNHRTGQFEPCPECVCPTCAGIGFLRVDVPLGHPMFGQVVPCTNPRCPTVLEQTAQRQSALRKYCGLPSGYEDKSFQTFDELPASLQDGKLDARMAVELFAITPGHWVEVNGDSRNWVIVHGPCGTGKTALVSAAASYCMAAGEQVLYIRTPELFEAIQKRYNRNKSVWDDDFGADAAEDVLDRAKRAPLLILDEMDVLGVNGTDNKQDIMDKLLRHRHNENLPLLGTTNREPREFMRWGERTYSVMEAKSHWVYMGGASLRPGLVELGGR